MKEPPDTFALANENLGEILTLLDQLSAGMENVLLSPATTMAQADRNTRGLNTMRARQLLKRIGYND